MAANKKYGRTGLIAKKLGMTSIFGDDGSQIPVTVLHLDNCQVVSVRTQTKDGYDAVQLGVGNRKAKNLNKSVRGQFAKSKTETKDKVIEFRVASDCMLEVGATILASHFIKGQKVDIGGITIGKGFAGSMKRHNFAGLEASHGVSISHRSHGSTGQRQDPGKVWKNKKMAGHMGGTKTTTQNLEVVSTDDDEGLILVKGSVPGPEGSYVYVKDAVKAKLPNDLPKPASIKKAW